MEMGIVVKIHVPIQMYISSIVNIWLIVEIKNPSFPGNREVLVPFLS